MTRRKLPWFMGALLAVGLLQAMVGIYQFGLRSTGPDHFAIPSLGNRFYRAYRTFEQPNPYPGYLALVLSLGIGVILAVLFRGRAGRAGVPWPKLVLPLAGCGVALSQLGAALVFSWSRGAWLGFGAAVLVMAMALPRQRVC